MVAECRDVRFGAKGLTSPTRVFFGLFFDDIE